MKDNEDCPQDGETALGPIWQPEGELRGYSEGVENWAVFVTLGPMLFVFCCKTRRISDRQISKISWLQFRKVFLLNHVPRMPTSYQFVNTCILQLH